MIVFYDSTRGTATARPIYGLHRDQNITVPEGVLFIEVANPPARCEVTHVVDEVQRTLVPDDARADSEAATVFNKQAMAMARAASNATIAGISWSANGYTPQQMRTRFLAAYKAL